MDPFVKQMQEALTKFQQDLMQMAVPEDHECDFNDTVSVVEDEMRRWGLDPDSKEGA